MKHVLQLVGVVMGVWCSLGFVTEEDRCVIGASLSEPHTSSAIHVSIMYVCMYRM